MFWYDVTNLGDSALLLPLAALVALWLLAGRETRRSALVWLLTVAVAGAVVVATKLLYMGWHVGIPGLDFIGLSGHTALSFVIWPVVLSFAATREHRLRLVLTVVGFIIAAIIGYSRLRIHVHSVSEVILGGFFGAAVSMLYLIRSGGRLRLRMPPVLTLASLLLVLAVGYGRVMPTEHMLESVARSWSGTHHVYSRSDLKR